MAFKAPKVYYAQFQGRKKGSIGQMYQVEATVTAGNESVARLKLYDDYEHVGHLEITELKDDDGS